MASSRDEGWQRAWAEAGLAQARRTPGREKYYAVVAYPGTSGFLHIGHLRGLLIADALHRFHRMMGRAVFFPTGTHASGLPAVAFAQKVAERDPAVVQQLRDNAVPEGEWAALADPATAARYLGRSYLGVFRRLGLLVDERAYVTTIDDDYRAFIGWQFRRLGARGALVQAPHFAPVCPVCGPVSVDPSETDLASGGDAEWVRFRTVPFPLDDGRVLLAATLRPETVYGVTNLWLPPTGELVVWHHGEVAYLVGRPGGERLVEQHGGKLGHAVPVAELIGRRVRVPLADREVPILASALVDPAVGTGVVMSVPAHAPADYAALGELEPTVRAGLGAIPVILQLPAEGLSAAEAELSAGDGPPAERALRATGARTLRDREALDAATERLYRLELVRGRMRPDLAGGRSVADAREWVAAELARGGNSFDLQEFSKPVVDRNGHAVVIRRVPDQWFLHYGDPAWKERTRALVRRMAVHPREYQEELEGILDWFEDRPCVRRGRWLGTPFPNDPSWVIEPIADSTFYPAYYIVRPYVADGRLPVRGLTDAFFDRVFLGEGPGEPSVDRGLQEEIREAFTYWYPLDANLGGKEHKRVHFPVFLYTHALLLPPELQPRTVFVHWWLTSAGGAKISKREIGRKGGAIPPILEAIDRWGADALRLFYAEAAQPQQDIEWDPELVDRAQTRLGDLERLARAALGEGSGAPPELERWVAAETREILDRVRTAFEGYDLRGAAEAIYGRFPALVRRYTARGGEPGAAMRACAEAWVRTLSPITPHLAEELGAGRGEGLVAVRPFPRADDFAPSPEAVAAERYLDRVEEDLRDVLRPVTARGETPRSAVFIVAAPWKQEVERWTRELASAPGGPVKEVMARAAAHPEVAAFRAEVPRYVARVAPLLRGEGPPGPEVDELHVLRAAEGYLARRYRFEVIQVVREAEAEPHDPMRRRERARPGRPAFYLAGARRDAAPAERTA